MVVVPVRVDRLHSPPARHVLELVATGEKNRSSLSSAALILDILLVNGSAVSSPELEMMDTWDKVNDLCVSYGDQAASLKWEATIPGEVMLEMLLHHCSGFALVRWGGADQRIDL